MAKVPNAVEILPKITIGWVGCTSVTDDRRQTDGRQHIAYVNVSSRTLKRVERRGVVWFTRDTYSRPMQRIFIAHICYDWVSVCPSVCPLCRFIWRSPVWYSHHNISQWQFDLFRRQQHPTKSNVLTQISQFFSRSYDKPYCHPNIAIFSVHL